MKYILKTDTTKAELNENIKEYLKGGNTFARIYQKVSADATFKRKKRTLGRIEDRENDELETLLHFQGKFSIHVVFVY